MRRTLGYLVLAAPFAGMFAFAVATQGLLAAIGVFAFVAFVVVWVFVGASLTS